MTIIEAMSHVKNGKQLTRKAWFNGVYVAVVNGLLQVVWPDGAHNIWRADLDDILESDWRIEGETL